jgi:hypothetical protein
MPAPRIPTRADRIRLVVTIAACQRALERSRRRLDLAREDIEGAVAHLPARPAAAGMAAE